METAPSPFSAGMACRCPRCGEGRLFGGVLRLVPACAVCGLDLTAADAADGPAFVVMTFYGLLVVVLAVWFELAVEPPLWLHIVLWVPVTIIGSVGLLRLSKSLLVAYQYRHRIGFTDEG